MCSLQACPDLCSLISQFQLSAHGCIAPIFVKKAGVCSKNNTLSTASGRRTMYRFPYLRTQQEGHEQKYKNRVDHIDTTFYVQTSSERESSEAPTDTKRTHPSSGWHQGQVRQCIA